MTKVGILSEIHGLAAYMSELSDSAFSTGKKDVVIQNLVAYYQAVACDQPSGQVQAAYQNLKNAIGSWVTDATAQARANGTVDYINGDIQD